ncbi:hypothetical protein [Psychroserpens mesophilus]|uniref:hypothetical protein n=1 Tax=Psychroserpens mesophilus TaxID=325473 RepID=UPI000590F32D|nr:hypothetical protein [Psychroserpens mesophilus]
MTSGIKITDTELKFTEFPSKETGITKYCKSFKLNLNEIKLIGISPRLILDDECIFILVIDKSEKIHLISDHVIGTKGLESFEKHFGLESIQAEWNKLEYDDHYGKMDKVIYPKEKYWNDLFDKDWKLKIRTLYSWIKPKSFYGNLNKKTLGKKTI